MWVHSFYGWNLKLFGTLHQVEVVLLRIGGQFDPLWHYIVCRVHLFLEIEIKGWNFASSLHCSPLHVSQRKFEIGGHWPPSKIKILHGQNGRLLAKFQPFFLISRIKCSLFKMQCHKVSNGSPILEIFSWNYFHLSSSS